VSSARAAARHLDQAAPPLVALRAAIAFRAGQTASAVKLWRGLDPRAVPEALVGRGLAAEQAGDRAAAQDYYRRYVALRGAHEERVRRWLELSLRFSRPAADGGTD
jgi:hypothetical protein